MLALSPGFMTRPLAVQPAYARLRQWLAPDRRTFVLLPSLDPDTCARETVRRQLARPFARAPQREAQMIRERFAVCAGLAAVKIGTLWPLGELVDEVVDEMAALLAHGAPGAA